MATKKKATKKKAPARGTAKKAATKKPMTKTELVEALTNAGGGDVTKAQIRDLLVSLQTVGHASLKKAGVFTLPGFAKFRVYKKPAVKARKGVNPFTGEEMMFKAKPASKVVRARPIKACKDAV
jgi:DNA-binding protein HU-beta